MTELEILQQRIELLENILSSLVYSDRYIFQKNIQMLDGRNIQLAKGTGTKIGTEITQKLAFYGLTPIAQPSSTGETTGASDLSVTNATTFNGNNGSAAYTILDIVKHLKNYGLLLK